MDCYKYEIINSTVNPILSNVDVTIILVMENSKRFKINDFLLSLSKQTIIQWNKGFKICDKSKFVTRSSEDINHAYFTAFQYTKNYNNVLIVEEDAEILNYDLKHYNIINDYIINNFFKVLSFGTNGVFKKINKDFYTVDVAHGAQAQIFSRPFREECSLAIKTNNFKGEIDTTYFGNNIVTVYNFPLIVQKFPETENFNNWSGNKIINKLGIKSIALDKTLNGWYIIHLISKLRGISKSILIAFTLIIMFLKLQKKI